MKSLKVLLSFMLISFMFCSCNINSKSDFKQKIKLLTKSNDSLKKIISNNIQIPIKKENENKLLPIILSPYSDYLAGDTAKIYGLLGLQQVEGLSLKVKIQNDSITNINNSLVWQYNYKVPNLIGKDTISGTYIVSYKNKKQLINFRFILNVLRSKNNLTMRPVLIQSNNLSSQN